MINVEDVLHSEDLDTQSEDAQPVPVGAPIEKAMIQTTDDITLTISAEESPWS